MNKKQFLVAQLAISGVFAGFLTFGSATPAAAQGSAFCPAGFQLINGFCVSPAFAAKPLCPKDYGPVSFGPATFACVGFSSSAAATQSLSTTTRAITDQSLYSTLDAVRGRLDDETQPCPAGSTRINGACRPISGGRAIGYAAEEAYAADLRPGRMLVKTAPTAVPAAIQTAIWLQAFGDYEHRSEITPSLTPTLGGVPGTLLPPGGLSTTTDLTRTTTSVGFIAGVDWTRRNVFTSSDALVFGLLGGYTSSHVKFKATENTTDLTGPSAGAFAAYASGPWSADLTFKTDFLHQNQTFADFTGDIFAISGSSSIDLNVYSVAGNINYKIPFGTAWYFEPTVGASYSDTVYGSGAAAIGLFDTNATRVQGGARVGTT